MTDNQEVENKDFRKSANMNKAIIHLRKIALQQLTGYESVMRKKHQQSQAPAIFGEGHLRKIAYFAQGFHSQAFYLNAKHFTKSNLLIYKLL